MTKWYPPRVLHLLYDDRSRVCTAELEDQVPLWKNMSVFKHYTTIHNSYPMKAGQTLCSECELVFMVSSL